jgi:putative endopeptidase
MKMKMKFVLPFLTMVVGAMTGHAEDTLNAGIKLENLDTANNTPGNDFYQYACGGWMKNNPLTAEYSRFGSFDYLAENNRKQLKEIILGVSKGKYAAGSNEQKIGTLYNIAMNSKKLNKQGITPVQPMLNEIKAVNDRNQLVLLIADYMKKGINGSMMGLYIDADAKESKNNILSFSQAGLTLGQKEYYLDTDEATTKIREAYKQHIVNMFKIYGYSEADATAAMNTVLRLETAMAEKSKAAAELRDPEANYNKMTVAELKANYKGIDWDGFLEHLGLATAKDVCVGQTEALQGAVQLLANEPIEDLKTNLVWQLMNASGSYLSDKVRAEKFSFFGKVMSGQEKDKDRWKRAVSTVEGVMGEGLGKLYVEKYFPEAAKNRMEQLIKNLQVALGERILAQDWMSPETKIAALEKLTTFYVKVGYPNKWKDYSALEIKDDSYWANIVRSNEFDWNDMVEKKLNKEVDRDEWYMTPQTVNAYYNPTTNEICFPAGILQYPFFDQSADDAFNYGAIGVVIGHEMTHGFDDQGRQFDKNGNLCNWWAEGDAERFVQQVSSCVEHFNNIEVLPGLHGNGALTLGENLADHGGLNVAFQAFKNATRENPLGDKEGYTADQRFFLSYANVWAGNIRDEEIRNRTKSDPHALGRWRVNGTLPHINAWYDAFGIKEGDKLYIPAEKRTNIW